MKTIIDFDSMKEEISSLVELAVSMNEDESYTYEHFYKLYLENDFFQVTIGALRYLKGKFTGVPRFCSTTNGDESDAVYQIEFVKGYKAIIISKINDMNISLTIDNFDHSPLDLIVKLDVDGKEFDTDDVNAYKYYIETAICKVLAFVVETNE